MFRVLEQSDLQAVNIGIQHARRDTQFVWLPTSQERKVGSIMVAMIEVDLEREHICHNTNLMIKVMIEEASAKVVSLIKV